MNDDMKQAQQLEHALKIRQSMKSAAENVSSKPLVKSST